MLSSWTTAPRVRLAASVRRIDHSQSRSCPYLFAYPLAGRASPKAYPNPTTPSPHRSTEFSPPHQSTETPARACHVCGAAKYRYLSSGETGAAEGHKDDKTIFSEVVTALGAQGISSEDIGLYWACLAVVLHLGNVVFDAGSDTAVTRPTAKLRLYDAHPAPLYGPCDRS